ncbi:hypothetical protein Bca52824_065788 [Brassica carinata]|uniref:Aspartate/ornithine carbamoyltransferase carbamoyl-P binding domain-containing protein n=1 Tax=Brassica carinata TaxID=52824 RepID=A0A8X7QP69_BRACI|nr:hypothetical protein Bca52824_065788 [Brassica carinata]
MKRLGGEVLTTENAREFSSAAKGETLEDTIRTVEGYSDIIVMRHFESGAAKELRLLPIYLSLMQVMALETSYSGVLSTS